MALGNAVCSVATLHRGSGLDLAGIRAQTQCTALVDIVALTGHEIDDLVFAKFVELARMRVGNAGHIPGIFNNGDLHAQANAEIRLILPPVSYRRYLCRRSRRARLYHQGLRAVR